jgi:hypothetical protein
VAASVELVVVDEVAGVGALGPATRGLATDYGAMSAAEAAFGEPQPPPIPLEPPPPLPLPQI